MEEEKERRLKRRKKKTKRRTPETLIEKLYLHRRGYNQEDEVEQLTHIREIFYSN